MKQIIVFIVSIMAFAANGRTYEVVDSVAADAAVVNPADSVADLRVLREYDYFFQYLPMIAAQIDDTALAEDVLSDVYIVNDKILASLGFTSPFRDKDITIYPFDNGIYVWQFPEPKETTLCLYVAFVPGDGEYRYYTLEKSIFVPWIVGSQAGSVHSSYFDTERPANAAAFVKLLKEHNVIGNVPATPATRSTH